jgi:hypothetical protein
MEETIMAAPWEQYQKAPQAESGPWSAFQNQAPKAEAPAQPEGYTLRQAAKDFMTIPRSLYRGVQDVTDTLAKGGASAVDMLSSNPTARAAVDRAVQANRQSFEQDYGDSNIAGASRMAGNIAATLPVGGALASGVKAVAPGATQLAQALRTGGMSGGNLATRAGAGAAVGGASAGLVNPEDATLGAVIGGALPVVGAGVMKGVRAGQRALRPEEVKMAEKLAAQSKMPVKDIINLMEQQGPQMLPGYQKTVPQLMQDPFFSQMQRNVKTAGVNAVGDVEALQQQAMTGALERVAPIQATQIDAAQRAGQAIQDYAIPAREEASAAVRGAFEAVDPFNETQLFLPIDEMKAAAGQYLGPGTFGTGSRAAQAIQTAEQVGTEVLPAVKEITQKAAGKAQNLEQAVRAAGGLRGTTGELRDLGIKQSKTTGLVNNKSGKSADLLAEDMFQRGFIPDNDPATLIDMLRNGGGRKVFASDAPESGFQRSMEMAMGDAPGAETIAKAVPFQTVQNLRSSIGEAAEAASAKGANKEAAALRDMVSQIDSRVNRAAGQDIAPGEFFPQEIADKYRDALKAHQNKMLQFETGPQAGMFRKGGDKQASIQGAEIPSKFYNSALSQADDVKAFKRLIGDSPALMDELKSFAITQADQTRNAQGTLGDKYIKWMKGRAGANKELMTPQELATIKEVGKAVENQMRTESLGMVSNSDTAQKAATMLNNGMIDSKVLQWLANKSSITGAALSSLKESATKSRNETLAKLLADPQAFANALKPQSENKALIEALRKSGTVATRSLPVMFAD